MRTLERFNLKRSASGSDHAPRIGQILRGASRSSKTDGRSRAGVYLLAGPGVEAGEGPERSVYDIAPSVLRFFGIEPPADLDGASLSEIAPRSAATWR